MFHRSRIELDAVGRQEHPLRHVRGSTGTHDDGPGNWWRVCGADEAQGSPYGSPQWGWNIACTPWH